MLLIWRICKLGEWNIFRLWLIHTHPARNWYATYRFLFVCDLRYLRTVHPDQRFTFSQVTYCYGTNVAVSSLIFQAFTSRSQKKIVYVRTLSTMQHSIVIHMKNFAQASPESIGSSIKASVEMGTHWLSWVIRLLLPSPQLRRVLPLLVPYYP